MTLDTSVLNTVALHSILITTAILDPYDTTTTPPAPHPQHHSPRHSRRSNIEPSCNCSDNDSISSLTTT